MPSSEPQKSFLSFTLIAALLLGAATGYLLLPESSDETGDRSANNSSTSNRSLDRTTAFQNPTLNYYFANSEEFWPPFRRFQDPAILQREIQEKEEQSRANTDAWLAGIRAKFDQLKGTPEGAAEIKWAKTLTNWGVAPEGPEVHERKRMAFRLWLDEDPVAALTAREEPQVSDLYLFIEDRAPGEIFGLQGLSPEVTQSLMTAMVHRKGGKIFDHFAEMHRMLASAHEGDERRPGSFLAYQIGNELPTSDRAKMIEHMAEFSPSVLDSMGTYMAERLELHERIPFLETIWQNGNMNSSDQVHERTKRALRKLYLSAYDLPISQRFESYMSLPDRPGSSSGWGERKGRAEILDVELRETFEKSERNFLHEYKIGELDAGEFLSEIEKLRPDFNDFPDDAVKSAIFLKLSEIDSSAAVPLLDGMAPMDRQRIVDNAIYENLKTGSIDTADITNVLKLASASPALPDDLSIRKSAYESMLERATRDMPGTIITNWLGTLQSGNDRDLLAGLLAAQLGQEDGELKNQAESLIKNDEFLELYQSGKLNPRR